MAGLGQPAMGHIKVLDTLSSRDRLVSLDKNPDCPLCGSNPTIKAIEGDTYSITCSSPSGDIELPLEVTPSMAKAFLRGDQPPFLLDVREHRERAICLLDDDQHIPTGELQWTWQSLPRDRPILIYCHHGIRSLYAARFLRDQGYALAQSLQGGIDGWSREVDPSVPRY